MLAALPPGFPLVSVVVVALVALGIVILNDRWKAYLARKKRISAARVARREAWLILGVVLAIDALALAGIILSLVGAAAGAGGGGGPRGPSAYLGAAFGLLLITLITLGFVGNLRRAGRENEPASAAAKGPKPNMSAPASTPASWWPWVFLFASLALMAFVNAHVPGLPRGPMRLLVLTGGFVALLAGGFVILVLHSYMRHYDRDTSRILRRAAERDVIGAMAELRELIEVRGPSARRSSALGFLLVQQERWEEAYKAFLDAEQQGGRQGENLANQALALWKAGHLSDAARLMHEASQLLPTSVVPAAHGCLILADLGRIDEAREQFDQALHRHEHTYYILGADRRPTEDLLAQCRERLASSPPTVSENAADGQDAEAKLEQQEK